MKSQFSCQKQLLYRLRLSPAAFSRLQHCYLRRILHLSNEKWLRKDEELGRKWEHVEGASYLTAQRGQRSVPAGDVSLTPPQNEANPLNEITSCQSLLGGVNLNSVAQQETKTGLSLSSLRMTVWWADSVNCWSSLCNDQFSIHCRCTIILQLNHCLYFKGLTVSCRIWSLWDHLIVCLSCSSQQNDTDWGTKVW